MKKKQNKKTKNKKTKKKKQKKNPSKTMKQINKQTKNIMYLSKTKMGKREVVLEAVHSM